MGAKYTACLDAWGDYAVTYKASGLTHRHNFIQDWLLTTVHQATASKEVVLPDGSRPGDILLHTWKGGPLVAVDLTVVHPLRPSEPHPSPESVKKMEDRQPPSPWWSDPLSVAKWGPLVIVVLVGQCTLLNLFGGMWPSQKPPPWV